MVQLSVVISAIFLLAGLVESTKWMGHGIPEFSLTGNSRLDTNGAYEAEVRIGSPSGTYKLQIDTGSDVTWIRCDTSFSAIKTTEPPSHWNMFRLYNSSTVSILTCGNKLCGSTFPTSHKCTNPDEPCPYSVTYADGRGSSGFYISDIIRLKMKGAESISFQTLAFLVYGCATEVRGDFGSDGVLALGHERPSIIRPSALISHCLKGGVEGGGFLMLGEVEKAHKMTYTPLDLSWFFYRVEIKNIAVDGMELPIDPRAFTNSKEHGTTVDAGSSVMYFVPEAYYPLIDAISNAVNLSLYDGGFPGLQCYSSTFNESVMHKFPTIKLNMKGDASILLLPREYLFASDSSHTCIGVAKSVDGFNSLGDIVLRDKLFEYDLNNKRLGWSSYDCSVSPNSTVKFPEFSAAGSNGYGHIN